MTNTSVVAKSSFAVVIGHRVISDGWHTRKAAVNIYHSQQRYAAAIGQSAEGMEVIQGGYDADSGDKMLRVVYPKRSAWRLV